MGRSKGSVFILFPFKGNFLLPYLAKLKNNIFYYFLLFFNNKFNFILYLIILNIIFSLYFSNNIVYCMDDINENVSSPESDSNIGFKKRKFYQTDDLMLSGESSVISDNNVVSSNVLNPSFSDNGLVVDSSTIDSTPRSGITINFDNAFKYVGIGVGIGSAALGSAKIIKLLPPHSRATAIISIAGIAAAYKTAVDSIDILYKYGRSTNIDLSKDKDSIINKKISLPKDYSLDTTLKCDDYSIRIKVDDDSLTLSDLKKSNTSTSSDVITENLSVTDNDYYKITDSHNISSVLENGDLITIFNNNPYLKLEGILFFTLSIMLYALIALTIINLISKYSTSFNNYFKNKYILMYINLNKKYINVLTWVWTIILFLSIILCLIISYVLIDTYDMYCLQSPYYK